MTATRGELLSLIGGLDWADRRARTIAEQYREIFRDGAECHVDGLALTIAAELRGAVGRAREEAEEAIGAAENAVRNIGRWMSP